MNVEVSDLELDLSVKSVKAHRNGVGAGYFWVVQFELAESPDPARPRMLGVVFERINHVAVLDLDDLNQCWRGDEFELQLRQAVQTWKDEFFGDGGS